MPKSIDYLKSNEAKKTLSLLAKHNNALLERMSDFECFALCAQNLVLLPQNKLKTTFLKLLEQDLNKTIPMEVLQNRELIKKLWRVLYSDENAELDFDFSYSTDLKSADVDFYNNLFDFEIFDITYIVNRDSLYCKKTLADTIDCICKIIENHNTSAILADVDSFAYCRPDAYHAELVYQKYINGENCNFDELSILKSWVLICIFQRTKAELFFKCYRSCERLSELVSMFDFLKNAPPMHICIDLSKPDNITEAANICFEKNISSEIIISEEMKLEDIKNNLKLMLSQLPITHIKLCRWAGKVNERTEQMLKTVFDELASERT